MRIPVLLSTAALLAAACGPDEAAFRPTENVRATRTGQPAAAYDVRARDGTLARVNVWSEGAYRATDGRTIAHLVMEVRNTGRQPIRLNQRLLELEAFSERGEQLPTRLVSVAAEGPTPRWIPPARAATVHLYFAIPGRIDPDELGSLRFRWGLNYDGRRYVQFTDFVQRPEPRYAGAAYYSPVYGFYDPWLYGPSYFHRPYYVPVQRVYITPRARVDARADRRIQVQRRR